MELALFKKSKQKVEIHEQRYDLFTVIQLVEPNHEEIVTLQLPDDEPIVDMYLKQLIRIANTVNADVILDENTVTFNCQDSATAEKIRKKFK